MIVFIFYIGRSWSWLDFEMLRGWGKFWSSLTSMVVFVETGSTIISDSTLARSPLAIYNNVTIYHSHQIYGLNQRIRVQPEQSSNKLCKCNYRNKWCYMTFELIHYAASIHWPNGVDKKLKRNYHEYHILLMAVDSMQKWFPHLLWQLNHSSLWERWELRANVEVWSISLI